MAEIFKSGNVEILDPQNVLDWQLRKIERIGRISYRSEKGEITNETALKFIKARMKDGHFPILEHGVMSVIFTDVSIGMSRENNRHRICSIVERSTRYVDNSVLRVRLPDGVDENEIIGLENGSEMSFKQIVDLMEMGYRGLKKQGWRKEDARQLLPIGTETEEGMTANFRAWRHIIWTRTAKPAHWEIRGVMLDLLDQVKTRIPVVFDDIEIVGKDSRDLAYCEMKYRDEY